MNPSITIFIIGMVLGAALALLLAPFCAPAYDYDEYYRGNAQHQAEGLYRDKQESLHLQQQYNRQPDIYKEPC